MKLLNNRRLRWPVKLRWYHTVLAIVWALSTAAGASGGAGPFFFLGAFLMALIVVSLLVWVYRKGRAFLGRGGGAEPA